MRRLLPLCVFGVLALASVAHAQLSLPGLGGAATIVMIPAQPQAGQTVQLTLESALFDLTTSSITWYANGKRVAGGDGLTGITVMAGDLGKETSVEADVVTSDGTPATATTSIVPTKVDLLFDADSYVPPFYKGRALPSAGTILRLQAVAYFKNTDGSFVQASDIVYTWKRNGQVLGSVSGRGRSSASIAAPYLFGSDIISVDTASVDGNFIGSASSAVPSYEPQLRLYEDHPLFGLMLYRALATSTQITEREMTFAAIPYFAQATDADDPALEYAWQVNNTPTAVSGVRNEIAIGTQGNTSAGVANIKLSVTHQSNIFLAASGLWSITLSSTASAGDVFQPAQ